MCVLGGGGGGGGLHGSVKLCFSLKLFKVKYSQLQLFVLK